jgi:hypothetical protein
VAGARAALDADSSLGPEPGRTYFLVVAALLRSRLALAEGRAADAAKHAADIVEYLRSRGVRVMVAGARVALARARVSQGRLEEAERELAAAAEEAERLHERLVLAEALALAAEVRSLRSAPAGEGER